ncbi:MAG: hypothetical protein HQM08_19050 [Candidatus Riflebacteria bacterium]|nr:hypothetical protein [Candidatus Riflebacteria bacterium]
MKHSRIFLAFVMGVFFLSSLACFAQDPAATQPAKDKVTDTQVQAPAAKAEDPEGKTFEGAGKEWMVGKVDLDWNAAQTWIKSLGSNWQTPTKDDLEKLFKEVGQKCPIGQDNVWTEQKDKQSAWQFSFYYREVRWAYLDDHGRYGRSVAVRTK